MERRQLPKTCSLLKAKLQGQQLQMSKTFRPVLLMCPPMMRILLPITRVSPKFAMFRMPTRMKAFQFGCSAKNRNYAAASAEICFAALLLELCEFWPEFRMFCWRF